MKEKKEWFSTKYSFAYFLLLIVIVIITKTIFNNIDRVSNSDYLNQPWTTVRIDNLLIQLPSKPIKEENDYKPEYEKVFDKMAIYAIDNNDLFVSIMQVVVNVNYVDSWKIDESSEKILNQVLFNLNAQDLTITTNQFNESKNLHYIESEFIYKSKIGHASSIGLLNGQEIFIITIVTPESSIELDKVIKKISESINLIKLEL
jgi:hypothetical protein